MDSLKVCSFCVKPLGKSSYKKVTKDSHRHILHIIVELGYKLSDVDYICMKCSNLMQKRVKIEIDYQNRYNLVSILRNRSIESPQLDTKLQQPKTPQIAPLTMFRSMESPQLDTKLDLQQPGPETSHIAPLTFSTPTKSQSPKTSRPPSLKSKSPRSRGSLLGTPKSARKLQFGGVKRLCSSPSQKSPYKCGKRFKTIVPTPVGRPSVSRSIFRNLQSKSSQTDIHVQRCDKGTQCDMKMTTDAQISVMTKKGVNVKNVKDDILTKLCRAIVHGHGPERVIQILYQSDRYKEIMEETVCSTLGQQCREIARKGFPSVLLHKEADDLSSTDPFVFINEWQERSALFVRFLETVAADAPHAMMSIGSIALFARNAEMSRLQTVLGLILDDAGATDEAIDIMNKFFLSVSSSTVLRRKKSLVKKHASMRKDWFCSSKERLEAADLVNGMLAEEHLRQRQRQWQEPIMKIEPSYKTSVERS